MSKSWKAFRIEIRTSNAEQVKDDRDTDKERASDDSQRRFSATMRDVCAVYQCVFFSVTSKTWFLRDINRLPCVPSVTQF